MNVRVRTLYGETRSNEIFKHMDRDFNHNIDNSCLHLKMILSNNVPSYKTFY